MEENERVLAEELIVLSKYEGDPVPENEIERIKIRNGEIVSRDIIRNGQVVSSDVAPGGNLDELPKRPSKSAESAPESEESKSNDEQEVN